MRALVCVQVLLAMTGTAAWNLVDVGMNFLLHLGKDAHMGNGFFSLPADQVYHLAWYYNAIALWVITLISVWMAISKRSEIRD